MKKKILIVACNALMDAIPILIPLFLDNKDSIISYIKKMRVKILN